jgi:Rod binding domain-containing protein
MPTISPVQTAMNSAHSAADAREAAGSQLLNQSTASQEKMKSTFQDFAAGTFYKEMLKSLRKMHNKPAYMYGGHAEEIFQGQMDQQVAESMAHSKGSQISDPLFKGFLNHAGNR